MLPLLQQRYRQLFGTPLSYKDLALKLGLGAEDMNVIASELQKDNVGLRIVQDALKN